MATARGSLVGENNKEDIGKTIIKGLYDIFISTNHTPIRSPYIVRILCLVGNKEESQKILNGTCTSPTYMDKGTKKILLRMSKTQTVKALGEIKVQITRESFRYQLRRSRENKAPYISGIHLDTTNQHSAHDFSQRSTISFVTYVPLRDSLPRNGM